MQSNKTKTMHVQLLQLKTPAADTRKTKCLHCVPSSHTTDSAAVTRAYNTMRSISRLGITVEALMTALLLLADKRRIDIIE